MVLPNNAMITRREFTRSLGGAAALVSLSPILAWTADESKLSADAAKLSRDSFILDCNALASIGGLHGRSNQDEITRVIRESGVTALKATLGGAMGNFEAAIMDIAAAEQLMEKRADLSEGPDRSRPGSRPERAKARRHLFVRVRRHARRQDRAHRIVS